MQDVRAYVALDEQQLRQRVERKDSVWCGWARFLGSPDAQCVLHASPFGRTLVALADHHPGTAAQYRPGKPLPK